MIGIAIATGIATTTGVPVMTGIATATGIPVLTHRDRGRHPDHDRDHWHPASSTTAARSRGDGKSLIVPFLSTFCMRFAHCNSRS
jgi:hypothetical protein